MLSLSEAKLAIDVCQGLRWWIELRVSRSKQTQLSEGGDWLRNGDPNKFWHICCMAKYQDIGSSKPKKIDKREFMICKYIVGYSFYFLTYLYQES